MWTKDQRTDFANVYILTSKIFDKEISYDLAKMVVEDLQDLDFQKCYDALSEYRKSNKYKFWPKPSDIRAIVNPSADPRQIAILTARKIDAAVKKYGWTWYLGDRIEGNTYFLGGGKYHWTFKEAVIAECGAIAWHAICQRGHWMDVRNSANEMEEHTFIAQMRDQIEASYNLQLQGIDILKIEMPKIKDELEYAEKAQIENVKFNIPAIKEIPK